MRLRRYLLERCNLISWLCRGGKASRCDGASHRLRPAPGLIRELPTTAAAACPSSRTRRSQCHRRGIGLDWTPFSDKRESRSLIAGPGQEFCSQTPSQPTRPTPRSLAQRLTQQRTQTTACISSPSQFTATSFALFLPHISFSRKVAYYSCYPVVYTLRIIICML